MKKGILFDLDGTLWDSSKEVADSWLLALEDYPEMKAYVTMESIQSVMGKTMDEIADILFAPLPEEKRQEVLAHCMKVENEYIEEHGGHLLEGLEETLELLQKEYSLYIVSNCQIGYIEAFLKKILGLLNCIGLFYGLYFIFFDYFINCIINFFSFF